MGQFIVSINSLIAKQVCINFFYSTILMQIFDYHQPHDYACFELLYLKLIGNQVLESKAKLNSKVIFDFNQTIDACLSQDFC